MPYIVVENFKGGLDSRRSSIVSAPGTLLKAENVHITRGAEVEKRKAFKTYASVPGSYGIEATGEGVIVYKSTNNEDSGCIEVYRECLGAIPESCGGWYPVDVELGPAIPEGYVIPEQFNDNSTGFACPLPPAGVTYQYLDHPDGVQLVDVPFSTVYGGKTFAIAKFANGDQIPFLDGQIVPAFINGYTRASMGSIANFAEHIKTLIQEQITESQRLFEENEEWNDPIKDYSVYRSGNDVYISGKGTNDFACKVYAEAPIVVTSTTTTQPQEAIPAVAPKASFIVAGGTDGSASVSTTLRFIDASSLPGITGIYVRGTDTATADGEEITGLSSPLFYNSITPTDVGYVHDEGQRLAWSIKEIVHANSASHGLSTEYYYNGGNWSGSDPATLTIKTSSSEGAEYNDQYVHIEFASDPSSVSAVAELIDVSTVVVSPYDPTRFIAVLKSPTAGKFTGGSDNAIYSIKVNDTTELISERIPWSETNENVAFAILTNINQNTSSGLNHGYTAKKDPDGNSIELTAPSSLGITPNGYKIIIKSSGTVLISGVTKFSGGVLEAPLVHKTIRVSFSGTFSAGKTAWVLITDPERPSIPYKIGATRVSGIGAAANVAVNGGFRFAFTYKYKMYVAVGSVLYFSALNNATKWDTYDTGSGFIDLSNNFGGRENLTGAGVYQDNVALFTERNCQLWFLDPDPNLNAQRQVLDNTGSIAPNTVISVGSVDLFYLSYNGVRSLKARESTDAAYANDIGSPIDETVVKHINTLTEDERYKSKAIIEPHDGRYWITTGGRLFVLSSFQGSSISAWSEYVLDFEVTDIVAYRNSIYIKSNDTIYLYGGATGNEYDGCHVDVELPYLDANKPGTFKSINGIDATCEGEWVVNIGFDYTNPEARDEIATITQPTFALGTIPATGICTHIGIKMTSDHEGYCRLANVLVHYDALHSKHEAG